MSKGFATKDGDVVVTKTIEMVDGNDLLAQKVERVLGTNLGEWSYDEQEGIDFSAILRKNPDIDEIRATIQEALYRLDDTLSIADFSLSMEGRAATITFHASNANGETVGGDYTYAD